MAKMIETVKYIVEILEMVKLIEMSKYMAKMTGITENLWLKMCNLLTKDI